MRDGRGGVVLWVGVVVGRARIVAAMLRSMSFAVTALLTSGCWGGLWGELPPETPRCEPMAWSVPGAGRELETFAPEAATGATGATKRPRRLTITAGSFDAVGFAESVYPTLAPLVLPSLQGGVVVCDFDLRPVPGIDGIDGPSGPITTSSTPDLVVWAEAGAQKMHQGPKFDSLHATFAFKLNLETGQRIRFSFVDFDFFSANEGMGYIDGAYPGRLPFSVRGRGAVALCGALSAERVDGLAGAAERALAREMAQFEAYEPTVEAPVDHATGSRIAGLLGQVGYFRGEGAPLIRETIERVGAASERQWGRYVEILDGLAGRLPPPAAWVSLNDGFEGRVAGVICQSGHGLAPSCGVELLLRAKAAVPRAECPAGIEAFGGLGKMEMVASDGATETASIRSLRRGKEYLRGEADVAAIKVGDVLSVEVYFAGYHYRTSAKDWDLPLLRVGKTVLRVL